MVLHRCRTDVAQMLHKSRAAVDGRVCVKAVARRHASWQHDPYYERTGIEEGWGWSDTGIRVCAYVNVSVSGIEMWERGSARQDTHEHVLWYGCKQAMIASSSTGVEVARGAAVCLTNSHTHTGTRDRQHTQLSLYLSLSVSLSLCFSLSLSLSLSLSISRLPSYK